MNIAQLRENCRLSAFTYLLGFMKNFAWEEEKNFVPIKKENPKSKTRKEMESAIQYLAKCEIGIGLDPKRIKFSMNLIKNWKFYFIQYMSEKENQQMVEKCQRRIMNASRKGKIAKCTHKDHKLGRDGASALADNLFRMTWDAEVNALKEAPVDPYWTRDAGPVEWGRSLNSDEFMARQFAEICTGPYYSQTEDEHSVSWKLVDGEYGIGSDDEVTEDQEILPIRQDWKDKNERTFELRQDILHGKFSREKILKKAQFLAKTNMIGWNQFKKIREFAAAVAVYKR